MSDNLKQKAANGVLWSAIDRFSSQGIQFLFNILIARILLPEDYGVVAMLGIFIAVAQTFIDSGFGTALIQKQDRTEEDCNTVFYFNLVISLICFAILWLSAPAIARFYKVPLLTKITRVFSFTLIINALAIVQNTNLSIRIDFRTKAFISIITVSAIGIIGLIMARKGYGVWTLVAQAIVGSGLRTALAWWFVKWRPRPIFSWKSFKEMFSYGSKLLASGLLDTIWGNMYNLVIGRVINPTALGNYNRAESFATFPSANIYGLVSSVSFPVLCSIQDDLTRLRESFRKFIRLFAFITFPMAIGLAAVADPFIRVILTDKWADSIPLLQILCVSLMIYPINALNITFPNILGHSDYYLRIVICTKILSLVTLCCTVPFGLVPMCIGQVVCSWTGLFFSCHYTGKLIGYNVFDQLKDILPSLALTFAMGAIVYCLVQTIEGHTAQLLVGIIAGIAVYWGAAAVFKMKEYTFLKEVVSSKLSAKKN